MPRKQSRLTPLFLSMLLFVPVLLLSLTFTRLLLPGEALSNYRFTATESRPPGSSRQLVWKENTTGHSLTLPRNADIFLLEGTLAPGQTLLIPSFFGTVTASDVQAETSFSGNACFLLTQQGSFSLQVHLPFRQNLHPRILNSEQLLWMTRLMRSICIPGLAALVLCLFPGPGRGTSLIIGLYLLLSSVSPEAVHPARMFTAKLLLLSLCPATALIAFKRRYCIDSNQTDILLSFTMSYGVCLIYYHFDIFNRSLLLFGASLQIAGLLLLVYLARQHHSVYAPAACASLVTALTAFAGLWMSLALGISGCGWLMTALACMVVYLLLLRLPAPAPRKIPVPLSQRTCRALHFTDFEDRLKKLGFDIKTIERIQHKCNTSSRHMQHVAEYTRAICIAMGFSPEKTEAFSSAALLHDLGKIEIPDAILFDPGKLTAEAFTRLCSHNQLGYALLMERDTEFFRLAAEIALLHHECMDGTGYLKLKGEEIPLPARIVAVADVFDALTAPRVYKQPWDFETAFSHIVENRGILFDSAVVDDFIKCKPAIRQIYDSFSTHTT